MLLAEIGSNPLHTRSRKVDAHVSYSGGAPAAEAARLPWPSCSGCRGGWSRSGCATGTSDERGNPRTSIATDARQVVPRCRDADGDSAHRIAAPRSVVSGPGDVRDRDPVCRRRSLIACSLPRIRATWTVRVATPTLGIARWRSPPTVRGESKSRSAICLSSGRAKLRGGAIYPGLCLRRWKIPAPAAWRRHTLLPPRRDRREPRPRALRPGSLAGASSSRAAATRS